MNFGRPHTKDEALAKGWGWCDIHDYPLEPDEKGYCMLCFADQESAECNHSED